MTPTPPFSMGEDGLLRRVSNCLKDMAPHCMGLFTDLTVSRRSHSLSVVRWVFFHFLTCNFDHVLGTYVAVFLLSKARNPSYNCTIDGTASISHPPETVLPLQLADLGSGGMAACSGPVSDDGKSHELQVTISGSQMNPISFDYLQYTPTDTIMSGDHAFSRGDPSVALGPTDPDTLALLPGSTLDFTFIGTSIVFPRGIESRMHRYPRFLGHNSRFI